MKHFVFAMDTCFSNSIVGIYPYEVRCEILAELGFDGIYVSLSPLELQNAEKMAVTKEKYGIKVTAAYGGFDISTDKLRTILTQKWCALNGISPQPIWVDYRRTGYPDFLHFTEEPARKNDTPPVRLFYPQTEISTNNENVLKQGTINLFTSKIFWQNR